MGLMEGTEVYGGGQVMERVKSWRGSGLRVGWESQRGSEVPEGAETGEKRLGVHVQGPGPSLRWVLSDTNGDPREGLNWAGS